MKLGIVGSRTFNDFELLSKWAYTYITAAWGPDITILSGGAKGADSLAEQFADQYGYEKLVFPAEWDKYGKVAGFIRNQLIVDNCDMVLAFWDGYSKGAHDTINKAKKAKKPTFIVYI